MDSDREEMWNIVIAAFLEREVLKHLGLRAGTTTIGEAMEDLRRNDPDEYAFLTEHVLWGEDDNG